MASKTNYIYRIEPLQGSPDSRWAVIETSTNRDESRVIARCREKDDAFIISGLYQGMEAGEVAQPSYGAASKAMNHLLSLEPNPEDAKAIRASLEPGWESDVAGAFGRAARKHYGMSAL